MKNKYDLIFSLGQDCGCAGLLNFLHLRKESCPFDWVGGSTFEKRAELLMNDFEDYLNPIYIERQRERERETENVNFTQNRSKFVSYRNRKWDISFQHDFYADLNFKENMQIVSEKYKRRIERLYKRIKKSQKVLLVYLSRENIDIEIIKKVVEKINLKFDNKIDLLFISNRLDFEKEQVVVRKYPYLYYVELNNYSSDPSHYLNAKFGNIPVISNVLYKLVYGCSYKSNKRRYNVRREITKVVIKIGCCFIPSRKIRRILRDKVNDVR